MARCGQSRQRFTKRPNSLLAELMSFADWCKQRRWQLFRAGVQCEHYKKRIKGCATHAEIERRYTEWCIGAAGKTFVGMMKQLVDETSVNPVAFPSPGVLLRLFQFKDGGVSAMCWRGMEFGLSVPIASSIGSGRMASARPGSWLLAPRRVGRCSFVLRLPVQIRD